MWFYIQAALGLWRLILLRFTDAVFFYKLEARPSQRDYHWLHGNTDFIQWSGAKPAISGLSLKVVFCVYFPASNRHFLIWRENVENINYENNLATARM